MTKICTKQNKENLLKDLDTILTKLEDSNNSELLRIISNAYAFISESKV